MSDVAWQARPISPEELEPHFRQIRSSAELEARLRRDHTRIAWSVAGGMTLLAMGLGAVVAYVHVHQPLPPPPRFIEVHDNGFVGVSMGASEAPRLFNERVAEHYLRDYITACLSYVPETYQLTVHQCAIMSAPDEQQRIAARIAAKNPNAPVNVYGAHGYAMPFDFHFTPGRAGRFHTLSYGVRFRLMETANSRTVTRWWSAPIDFQWHPELPMADQDRLFNEAGMQVLSFTPEPDPGQPQ